jgi:hypothetical protein
MKNKKIIHRKVNLNWFFWIVFAISLTFGVFAGAEDRAAVNDTVQLSSEGVSSDPEPNLAKAESQKDAISKAVLKVIGEYIGLESLEKNSELIKTKILPRSSKFIQFYKSLEPTRKGNETTTVVSLRISVSSLKNILSAHGLLVQNDNAAFILPLITIVDKRNPEKRYQWWLQDPTNQLNLSSQIKSLHERDVVVNRDLESAFKKRKFSFVDRSQARGSHQIPESIHFENPQANEFHGLAQTLKVQIILLGEITFEPVRSNAANLKVTAKFKAVSASSGKVVAQVNRSFESKITDWNKGVFQTLKRSMPEVTKDLMAQVGDEWNKSSINSNFQKISIRGQMGFQDLENFKKQILLKFSEVKNIRERRQERGLNILEIDTSSNLSSLSKHISQTPFEGFKLAVDDVQVDKIDLRWSKAQP